MLVRADRKCEYQVDFPDECQLDKVRRTVWDGDQELYEIQVPSQTGHDPENDGEVPVLSLGVNGSMRLFDPNPFFGRVGYVHAAGVDRPLSVLRMGYVDRTTVRHAERVPERWGAFAMFPLWTPRGQAEIAVYPDGGLYRCVGVERCVRGTWVGHYFVLERPKVRIDAWQGSLIEDKRDAAGTLYRRNRYLDPQTGRFTQEDPIGLAGGMNVYGYANGDAVSYNDPYGLKVCASNYAMRQAVSDAANATITWDKHGCVDDLRNVTFKGGREWRNIQNLFAEMVIIAVSWTIHNAVGISEHHRPNLLDWAMSYTINIAPNEMGVPYRALRAVPGWISSEGVGYCAAFV